MMHKIKWGTVALAALSVFGGKASANLISINTVPSTGNGIGAVNTALTFSNIGTESGCVAFNGTTQTTGTTSCPAGFTGGNEDPGAQKNLVYTAADLGFTATRNFLNLALIFNGNEGGNNLDQPIILNSLGLSLYSATGVRLATFTTTQAFNFNAFPGTGNAGFGFALDTAQAGTANSILAANPNLRIGVEANASNAQGGAETIQLTTLNTIPRDVAVPEPSTGALLLSGFALIGMATIKKRRRA